MPGAYELPLAALYLAETGRIDGVACLGAVIRGETDHYDYVCDEAARGIQDVQLRTGVPCAFGVLTVESMEQALARSGGDHRDAGYHAGAGRAADGRAAGRAARELRHDRPHLRAHAAAPTRGSPRRSGRRSGDARTVVNVGAGTGSYEPPDREVTAVEPSAVMIAQRPPEAAPVVQASAEALPFEDASFDAAMAVLTIHHWTDWRARHRGAAAGGRRVVVLSVGPGVRRPAVDQRRVLPRADRRGRAPVPVARRPGGRGARDARHRRSRSRTTARTASTARTGGGRRPTSTPTCGRASRRWPSGRRRRWRRGWSGSRPTCARAPGPSATPTCSRATSSTSATASSSA